MKSSAFYLTISILSTACLLVGCGYSVRATGEPLGVEIESIAIPLVETTSSQAGFEADFSRIIREEFISHSKVPLLPAESAQVILTGRIYDIRTKPIAYDSRELTVEGNPTTSEVTSSRRMRVKADFRLTERVTGKTLWHEKAIEEQARFLVVTDPLENRYNKRVALEEIARRLAKRVFLKTMERF